MRFLSPFLCFPPFLLVLFPSLYLCYSFSYVILSANKRFSFFLSRVYKDLIPMADWTYEPPQNVSAEHFWLQHLARSYLRDNHCCSCVGTEVSLPIYSPQHFASPEDNKAMKYRLQYKRLDVVAVGPRYYISGCPPTMGQGERRGKVSIAIEVKVSHADFNSGFHKQCCNFNYVLAPASIVKKSEMPKGCGLLSADRDEWSIRIVHRAPELKDCAFSIETAIFAIGVALTTEYANRIRNATSSRVTWIDNSKV